MTVLQTAGLSHSEIRASRVICTYTRLIAAYHVLLRLDEPEASAIRPSLLSNSRRDRSTPDVHVLGGVKDTAETLSFLTYKSCL